MHRYNTKKIAFSHAKSKNTFPFLLQVYSCKIIQLVYLNYNPRKSGRAAVMHVFINVHNTINKASVDSSYYYIVVRCKLDKYKNRVMQ